MEKTTYILGAGFSRYTNLPLMNDFYFRSKEIFSMFDNANDKKSFDSVFEYFDKFSKVKNTMEADFFNIEELLSIIEMDSFINGNNEIYADYINYLRTVIELCSPNKETKEGFYLIDNENDTEIYTNFIKRVFGISEMKRAYGIIYERDANNDNGIISLNYDLILEKALKQLNKSNYQELGTNYHSFDFDYGISNDFVNYCYTDKPRFKKLKLSKIHGSLNFTCNNLPLIIPPTWNKTSHKEMQKVWKFSHEIISQSNKIIFIGYSLPETDLYVKYLLICGIKDCYNLKEVTVICKDDKHIVQPRYEKFFDINFRNKAFNFESITFEEWLGIPKKKTKLISRQF